MEAKDKIIVALDVSGVDRAMELVNKLSPYVGLFKIGLEFIWSSIADLILLPEPAAIAALQKIRALAMAIGGQHCFLDPKLADIPNTVKYASVAISRMGVKMFNIHASAGAGTIRAAVEYRGDSLILGVTVLTSIDEFECISIFGADPGIKVIQFAEKLEEMGASGVICSPKELESLLMASLHRKFLKIVPGVRPIWAAVNDQKRVMTPAEAIKAGADYLVIGRPITSPPAEIGGPIEAAQKIAEEIAGVLKNQKGDDGI